MLTNSFYRYGLIAKTLNFLIWVMVLFLYVSYFISDGGNSKVGLNIYYLSALSIFFLLCIHYIWFISVPIPFSNVGGKIQSIFLITTKLLLNLALFSFSIFAILYFIMNSYLMFVDNSAVQMSLKVFNVHVIPFAIIRLLGDLLAYHTNIDLESTTACLLKLREYMFGVVPILIGLYILQKLIYKTHDTH